MNIFSMPVGQMLASAEEKGGLFDFNATLPLMALQFILLTVVLTFVFYKPIGNVLEGREAYINNNLAEASAKLIQADELCKQYEAQLKAEKANAQACIGKAETEAKQVVSLELAQARKDAASLVEQVNKELEAQKELALKQLENEIDALGQLIKEKLLGKQQIL
jgi:F-type H+-transporting ATPase subunit b